MIAAVLVTFALLGCADRFADAKLIADPAGLHPTEIDAAPFRLTSFVRLEDADGPITIYIEGDGAAWITPYEPSLDPTPRKALALRLAALDPSPNVIYLARPCQFTKTDVGCHERYWTTDRFAEEIVASMNAGIDTLVADRPHPQLALVGYSGGGAIAALIAARRKDIVSLRTVAGNLDPNELTKFQNVSSLTGSLSPIDIAPRLVYVPQQHFVGGRDDAIPLFVSTNFLKALGSNQCATVTVVSAATHETGWEDIWPDVVTHPPVCRIEAQGSADVHRATLNSGVSAGF